MVLPTKQSIFTIIHGILSPIATHSGGESERRKQLRRVVWSEGRKPSFHYLDAGAQQNIGVANAFSKMFHACIRTDVHRASS